MKRIVFIFFILLLIVGFIVYRTWSYLEDEKTVFRCYDRASGVESYQGILEDLYQSKVKLRSHWTQKIKIHETVPEAERSELWSVARGEMEAYLKDQGYISELEDGTKLFLDEFKPSLEQALNLSKRVDELVEMSQEKSLYYNIFKNPFSGIPLEEIEQAILDNKVFRYKGLSGLNRRPLQNELDSM